ncbi:MAG: hypothetical protein PHI68_08105, partial [Candidatus Cloacimonetes bacterium]|nr:hypothetical protein [Candidatus Cloacimonadota bacterium]
YEDRFEAAASKLHFSDFYIPQTRGNLLEYRSETNEYVDYIVLTMEPETQKLVGWFIRYKASNTAEMDSIVLDTIAAQHGKENYYDEETEQLIWFLTDTRTCHVLYTENDSLLVLYYDAFFADLLKPEQFFKKE